MNTYVQEIDDSSRRVNIVSSGSLGKVNHCDYLLVRLPLQMWVSLKHCPENVFLYQVRGDGPKIVKVKKVALEGDSEDPVTNANADIIEENLEPRPEARKSWLETAAAAGVVTMVQANAENAVEENTNHDYEKGDTKKKTPKQYRCQPPKVKDIGKQLTVAEKKLFKEAFNTDKARFHKRQQKYQKEPNFLIIMEDNILGAGAATSGKMMVYGQGKVKESFLSGSLKFDPEHFYMHANHTDFQKEMVPEKRKEKRTNENVENGSKETTTKESHPKRFKPLKVATPGSYLNDISGSSGDDTS